MTVDMGSFLIVQLLTVLTVVGYAGDMPCIHSSQSLTMDVIQKEQVLASYTMQQQTHKNFQSARSHSLASAVLAKGILTSVEFKFGFPSTSPSPVSYKWWESCSVNNKESFVVVNVEVKEPKCESKESEKEHTPPANIKETNPNSPDPDSLTAIIKRAVEEGREALKLGV